MRKEYDLSQAKRSPLEPLQPGKIRSTIRLDSDIPTWFHSKVNEKGGGNYQTRRNDVLGSYREERDEQPEETLRRVNR
jgi:uncharacterized protein (DUF4415 family)